MDTNMYTDDHCYSTVITKRKICDTCNYKDALIKSYVVKLTNLSGHVRVLRIKIKKDTNEIKPLSWRNVKSDNKMNFYTGLSSIKLFNALQCYIAGTLY